MDLNEIIDRLSLMPEHSKSEFRTNVSEVAFSKGHVLLKAGKVEQTIFFIKKGLVRAYSDADDREVTFWFGKEGDPVLSMKSYVCGQEGYENVELLEDSIFYRMETRILKAFFDTNIHFANLGRRLVEQELIRTEERLISMQFKTAMERYAELVSNNPDLLQRVQLGHIASYLGITQVSLSRIRAEFR